MSVLKMKNSNMKKRKIADENEHVEYIFSKSYKHMGRGAVDSQLLLEICEARGLLEDRDWTENEMRSVANVAAGTHFVFSLGSDPLCTQLRRFKNKMDEELNKSSYFCKLMDPVHILVHTLPVQLTNRMLAGANVGFRYPNWPAAPRNSLNAPFTAAIEASRSNCPLEWYDSVNNSGILANAHNALYNFKRTIQGLTLPATVPVFGGDGALFNMVAGNPFMLTFADSEDCGVVLASIEGALRALFHPFVGFSYIRFTTDNALDFVQHN